MPWSKRLSDRQMKIMSKFIPIYQYAEDNKISVQNIYRWIREGKVKKEDIQIKEIVKKKLMIREDAQYKLRELPNKDL